MDGQVDEGMSLILLGCSRFRDSDCYGEDGEVEDPNTPHLDDIRTEYHPQSGRATETSRFEDYTRFRQSRPVPTDDEPWKPGFRTLEDFEFAEIMLEGHMNKGLCKRLIALFRKCLDGQGNFTLSSLDALQTAWDIASHRLTPVQKFSSLVTCNCTYCLLYRYSLQKLKYLYGIEMNLSLGNFLFCTVHFGNGRKIFFPIHSSHLFLSGMHGVYLDLMGKNGFPLFMSLGLLRIGGIYKYKFKSFQLYNEY